MVVYKLQRVPVSCYQQRINAVFVSYSGYGTKYVVCLVPLAFAYGYAHFPEQLLQQRKLGPKILRSLPPARLILAVLLMAEGRAVHIEGHQQIVRLVGKQL